MKDKGILFKPDGIKSIQLDLKTMTRRVMKPQPHICHNGDVIYKDHLIYSEIKERQWLEYPEKFEVCPFHVGQKLYVKETWNDIALCGGNVIEKRICYKQKGDQIPYYEKWKSPLFMPKKYARIWLEVTDIKVERLQDISKKDILKEGIYESGTGDYSNCYGVWNNGKYISNESATIVFYLLWDSINKKTGYTWETNPYTWVITFKRIEK